MSMTRRGLLKALGLGGVGLVAGAAAAPVAKSLASDPNYFMDGTTDPKPIVIRKSPIVRTAEVWEHPDMERIEAVLKLTGGYPNFWGQFHQGSVCACSGDRINIDYKIEAYGPPLALYRVYEVQKVVNVLGTSIQGPVVEDFDTPRGHRLATLEELWPNQELSVKQNQECTL